MRFLYWKRVCVLFPFISLPLLRSSCIELFFFRKFSNCKWWKCKPACEMTERSEWNYSKMVLIKWKVTRQDLSSFHEFTPKNLFKKMRNAPTHARGMKTVKRTSLTGHHGDTSHMISRFYFSRKKNLKRCWRRGK